MPYGGLIALILKHKSIQILEIFMKEELVNMEIGKKTMRKMHLRATMTRWMNVEN